MICVARSAFRRLHSVEYLPAKIIDFLVGDIRLANSVSHGLGEIQKILEIISGSTDTGQKSVAEWHIGKTRSQIEYNWPVRDKSDDTSILKILEQIRRGVLEVDNQINKTYFNYPIQNKSGS